MSQAPPSAEADEAIRTSSLLVELVRRRPGETIAIEDIVETFHGRAYGVLLLLVLLPAFIPLPIGAGLISGPLVSILGLELLLTLRTPWLPQRARRRTIRRETLARFATRMRPVFTWLERLCRPRLSRLTRSTAANAFTGVQLVALGLLLALPIPLTNYPFALLILAYAIAIIERDGALLLLAWVLGWATIATWVALSEGAFEWVSQWLST